MQKSVLVRALRLVLGAYRIVGTQFTQFEGIFDVLVNPPAYLYQAPKRAFGICRSRVEQHALPDARHRINALANRTGWISAFEGNGCDEHVRERVQ